MATRIGDLEIPIQRGSLSKELKTNDTSSVIQRGVYTGGFIYIDPQAKTARLTQNSSTITDENNKPISSVKIPAKNMYSVFQTTITPTDNATSFSVTGLSFRPVGIVIQQSKHTSKIGKLTSPYFIVGIFNASGVVVGLSGSASNYYGVMQSATVSISNGAITVSDMVANRNGTSEAVKFDNTEHTCFVWG